MGHRTFYSHLPDQVRYAPSDLTCYFYRARSTYYN